MYPEIMVIPMREELTRAGVQETRTAAEVDAALAKPGTTMLVVNSICGCAAGKMRPGVRLAMQNAVKPDQSITVFAGQDREATERARSYFEGQPPTSPAIAILRDGKLVYLMQRFVIEGATAHRPGTGARVQRILRGGDDGVKIQQRFIRDPATRRVFLLLRQRLRPVASPDHAARGSCPPQCRE
jgi:putative YphP/YqiW family bacilliredoxin